MRTIEVSTETFAALWARRQPGEETEEQILRRLLGLPAPNDDLPSGMPRGFVDQRFGVAFQEGTEIFRTYKGVEYRARANGGMWLLLNNQRMYNSLNKLSGAVVSGNENPWRNWKYKSYEGDAVLEGLRRGR